MKWTIFMPVLNEAAIIESKILHSLDIGRVVVVEGSIPQTRDVGSNGLSSDGTSEILKSYSDKIVYLPVGMKRNRAEYQNDALLYIHKNMADTEILHRTDADEFIDLQAIDTIEQHFYEINDWMIYTDLINFSSATTATNNVAPLGSVGFPFCRDKYLTAGMYHERFYRYRPDLLYKQSAHCLSDSMGRPLFAHPDYYFNRSILGTEICSPIFHYKYIDGFERLIKAEMSYLEEDEKMPRGAPPTFDMAMKRLRNILGSASHIIPWEEHCSRVRESKWFVYEPAKYNLDLTYEEFMSMI